MPLFSAIEAVTPAISRWQRLLFRDFRVGLLFKLSFVALLAEASGGGGNFNGWGGGSHSGRTLPGTLSPSLTTAFLVAAAVIGVIAFVIGIVIFYLSCRMKFVEFHIAATGDTRLSPAWRRYAPQTWTLFWLTIGIGVVGLIALAVVTVPIVLSLIHRVGDWSHPQFNDILGIILAVLPILFAWFLILALVMMVVRDFMLPVWALEGTSVSAAWQRARGIIEQAPGDFAKYALVKALLRVAAAFAGGLAWFLSMVITAIPVVGIGVAVYFGLRNGGPGATATMIFLAVVAAVVCLVWSALLLIVFMGAPLLALQCYSVEWLGGRYPLLGNLLWPMPPPPPPVVFDLGAPLPT